MDRISVIIFNSNLDRRANMKYSELSGWEKLIADACMKNPDLIVTLNQMIEQQEQKQSRLYEE